MKKLWICFSFVVGSFSIANGSSSLPGIDNEEGQPRNNTFFSKEKKSSTFKKFFSIRKKKQGDPAPPKNKKRTREISIEWGKFSKKNLYIGKG